MTSEGSSQDFFALFGLQRSFVVDEHRLNRLREKLLSEIMISLAKCEVSVFKTSQPRVVLERFLLDVAEISQLAN